MVSNQPTYRRNLNSKQLHLLKLIYKFRFVTVGLIKEIQDTKDQSTINHRLRVLVEQDYIGRNYNASYRLLGKQANYFLRPKGIAMLKDQQDFSQKALHAMYKNQSLSDSFIDHSLNIAKIYTVMRKVYPNQFSFFTKSELVDLDYFPKQLPDTYLVTNTATEQSEIFLDSLEIGSQFFVIKKKLANYIQHAESEIWEEQTGKDYPAVLLACGSPVIEANLHKHLPRMISSSGSEIEFYTTSTKSLIDLDDPNGKIWSPIGEPDELIKLSDV